MKVRDPLTLQYISLMFVVQHHSSSYQSKVSLRPDVSHFAAVLVSALKYEMLNVHMNNRINKFPITSKMLSKPLILAFNISVMFTIRAYRRWIDV